LADPNVGIIVLTSENQAAQWLNFEAGAISKQVDAATRVIPVLVDLGGSDLSSGPISQFQYREIDHESVLRIVDELAAIAGVDRQRVAQRVEDRWPNFAASLSEVRAMHRTVSSPRTDRELIEDIHSDVRHLLRTAGMEAREAGAAYEMRHVALAREWCEWKGYNRKDCGITTGHWLRHGDRLVEVVVRVPVVLKPDDESALTRELEERLDCAAAVVGSSAPRPRDH
jgi:hypothetical protein